jgi:O-antigen/teichoic acid export membrane protein
MASIGSALLNIALNYALIPVFGYLVAGYTTLFSYIVFGIVHYIFMRVVCKKNDCPTNIFDIKSMLMIMLLFACLTVILAIGYKYMVIRFAVIVCVILLCFVKRNVFLSLLSEVKKK